MVSERGYYTAQHRSEVPEAFAGYQRRLGLVVPVHSPDGETTSSQLRPDNPRRDKKGKALKYETPGGSRTILDVHPRNHAAVRDPAVDLWITEGVKKGDALASRGECAISLVGVWNWQRAGELLPCWDHVELKGRLVYVAFDSDVVAKAEVQIALERLVAALEGLGADVRVAYLPGGEGGEKVGADDFLAGGATVAELKALARRFEPEDLGRIRLSRDEKLRAAVEDLERRFWAEEWKGLGGHSDYDVALKLVEAARRHGQLVEGGIRVVVSWGTLQLASKISRRTLSKAISRLEERGFCSRDNEGRKADEAGAFVMRASVDHYGWMPATETQGARACDPGGLHLRATGHAILRAGKKADKKGVRVLPMPERRSDEVVGLRPSAPRLRHSAPARKPRLGTARDSRKVRQGPRDRARPAVKRLGKRRCAIVDVVEACGWQATLGEVAVSLHAKRPRDLRRRYLPMLEEAGILTVEDDLLTLTDNWLEALEVVREQGGEIEAEESARRDLARKRRAYYGRHKVRPDHHPANAGADGWVEDVERLDPEELGGDCGKPASAGGLDPPVSSLAAAIRAYLDRNPLDACQPPGWIAVTLWAFELVEGKPTPAEAESALEELGGERYRRELLEQTRTAG